MFKTPHRYRNTNTFPLSDQNANLHLAHGGTSPGTYANRGKQHKNVLRDVDRAIANVTEAQVNQLKSEPVDLGASEATYLDGKKESRRMLILNKQMVFTIDVGRVNPPAEGHPNLGAPHGDWKGQLKSERSSGVTSSARIHWALWPYRTM